MSYAANPQLYANEPYWIRPLKVEWKALMKADYAIFKAMVQYNLPMGMCVKEGYNAYKQISTQPVRRYKWKVFRDMYHRHYARLHP